MIIHDNLKHFTFLTLSLTKELMLILTEYDVNSHRGPEAYDLTSKYFILKSTVFYFFSYKSGHNSKNKYEDKMLSAFSA